MYVCYSEYDATGGVNFMTNVRNQINRYWNDVSELSSGTPTGRTFMLCTIIEYYDVTNEKTDCQAKKKWP